MADWYVSSVAWTAIAQFAASGVYSVGNIVRPLTAPAFAAQHAFRCTVAGTASTEPAWPGGNNATVTTGGATFANVTGQSAYGWAAAAGNLYAISTQGTGGGRPAVGDRVFLSSDHAETSTTASFYQFTAAAYGAVQAISVNRAGSVPPVAADALSGASIVYTGSGNWALDCASNVYWQGVRFTLGGSAALLNLNFSGTKSHYFRNCAFLFTTSTTTAVIATNNNVCQVTFDNTTVQFNAAAQHISLNSQGYSSELKWINTPAALLGTVPTILFGVSNAATQCSATCRGVDLSALTTTLYYGGNAGFGKVLLDSCRVASGLARLGTTTYVGAGDEVELVNCYDGTSFLSERHTPAGDLTTEFTITLSGGAQDNVGAFSHKMISSARSDAFAMPLEGFWMDTNYATTGTSKTATVEIVSSASLNNNDISLLLEYEGTTSSSLASFVSSLDPLASVGAVPSSTATWNSLPATPVRQHLQVTFTPRVAGRVRGQVRLGKPSTTVYVDPRMVIT